MTDFYFCTYFNLFYCAKGLALYRSLEKNVSSFKLYILCLDDETYEIFHRINLKSVELIQLKDLEARDNELSLTKATRSTIEYFFTLTPAFIFDVITTHTEIDILTYIDSDMFVYGPVDPVYKEFSDNSILVIEQRVPECVTGRFNVGYLSFRKDTWGIACLELWRKQCIEWCYDRLEGDKYGDQKYLDQWPELYPQVVILKHKGVNVSPWNADNFTFSIDNEGTFYVDEYPLIVFHFSIFKKIFGTKFFEVYDLDCGDRIRHVKKKKIYKKIYHEYAIELNECRKIISMYKCSDFIIEGTIRKKKSAANQSLLSFKIISENLIHFYQLFRRVLLYKNIMIFRIS